MNDTAVARVATRAVHERTFRTHDSLDLFYRHWPATTPKVRGAIVMFHRGHEHGGRMAHLPAEFDLPDFDFFAWDARGLGRSPGPRGDATGIATLTRDAQSFIDHIVAAHGFTIEDIGVVGQSVGAVLVAAWVHDYAPRIRCMVLASPAFKVKLYVPFARAGLATMYKLRGNFFVNSYVKAKFLTHDPERIASYDADPLITRPISVRLLLGLYETAERVVDQYRPRGESGGSGAASASASSLVAPWACAARRSGVATGASNWRRTNARALAIACARSFSPSVSW